MSFYTIGLESGTYERTLYVDGFNPSVIFNLGNNQPEKLMDFTNILTVGLGVKSEMEMLPMQAGDVQETFTDISKVKV